MGGNFKVRCINDGEFSTLYTSGKVYEISDGIFVFDDGEEIDETINCVEDLILYTSATWKLIEDEGENKVEDLRELIKPCYVVKLRDEPWCVAIKEANDLGFYKISRTDMIGISSISSYDESLNNKNNDSYDIVEIREYVPCILFSYKNAKLVWKRIEKSPRQIEIESIEQEQRKLADRLAKLKEA